MIRAALLALVVTAPAIAQPYVGAPEIVREGGGGDTISGVVFHDANRNSRFDRGEAGVEGVRVSNGLDWVLTDASGAYQIAVRPDMNLTIVQPAEWRVPVDSRQVPQFFYIHKRGGTPQALRYGGLPDTGPAPAAVNFPLQPRAVEDEFTCAIIGDSQTYSNREMSWFRDGVLTDLNAADLGADDCMLYVGDVMGDDLDMLDRLLETASTVGAPQWLVHGNHDYDFDALDDKDSADSWRRLYGPEYYAFEQGDVLFVALDNVVFPCGAIDRASGHDHCVDEGRRRYNGRVTETQFTWLEGLLASTPEDKLVVLTHHIPFVSFVDAGSNTHQTDELDRIHALVEGRPALSLSGHTHTMENHAPGQIFEGWTENTGTGPLPFRHMIAGAASGSWFQGDLNIDGNPMALQRTGGPKGVLMLEFDGVEYVERYQGSRMDPDRGQWVALSTPGFRAWYETIMAWRAEDWQTRDPVPPLSINDLPDPNILTPSDLSEGTFLTANVWAGSSETTVDAELSDGRTLTLTRTQEGQGEAPRIGVDYADPFATQRQLSVMRYAVQSRSGNPRAQGFEAWQGRRFEPAPPQPQNAVADRNMSLWTVRLPDDLAPGAHRITVTSTDRNGQEFTDVILVEVRDERPNPYFRTDLWED
jgi:hypothetical protein